jgi:beta-barrel assembly-enhancing protease
MKNPIRTSMVLLLSLSFILVQFSFSVPARAISVDDETVMGQKFMESVRRQFSLLDDDFATDYLNDLGQYLLQAAETRPFPFQFYLIRDNTLNAFAGPGGHVFMFSGLALTMATVDELAAVLCHEIAHVTARHLSDRMQQAQKVGIATLAGMLAGILIGGKAGGAITTGTMAAGIQKQLAYSRDDERQADQMGFQYMSRSGFNPGGMITTLTNLEKGQWHGADVVPPYLLTHPGGSERIANIESMLSSHPRREERDQRDKHRDLYPYFRTVIQAKTGEPHEMEALYRKELEKDPNSPLANFGLGVLYEEKSDHEKAIENFRKALRSSPDALPVLRKLAESYQLKGHDKEAIDLLERAFRADTRDKASLFLLGKSYLNVEDHTKAIRVFERLLLMKPVKDEVYYNLGVSYGRENRLPLAHYNFGIYFKRLGERNKAKFHFQKAEDLSRGDPVLTAKIREEAAVLFKRQ